MQGTVSPDACPNLWIFWQGSWTAHSPVSVTHGLLTEGEKWFSRLEHSCLLPPLPLLSLSQTSNHSPLPDPVTAASVWVAIWLKLCSATEVGPLRCAHVVLIVVNNFFLLLLLLTGHSGDRTQEDGLSAGFFRLAMTTHKHKGYWLLTLHRGCTCLQLLKRKGHAEAAKRMCLHF